MTSCVTPDGEAAVDVSPPFFFFLFFFLFLPPLLDAPPPAAIAPLVEEVLPHHKGEDVALRTSTVVRQLLLLRR